MLRSNEPKPIYYTFLSAMHPIIINAFNRHSADVIILLKTIINYYPKQVFVLVRYELHRFRITYNPISMNNVNKKNHYLECTESAWKFEQLRFFCLLSMLKVPIITLNILLCFSFFVCAVCVFVTFSHDM